MPNISAANPNARFLEMDVYPNNEFLLVEVEGSEYLSHPYCYKLTALSYDRDINIENLLNQPVSVTITQGQQVNYLHGLIFESKRAELGADGMQTYHFFICPWLRFLELKSDCRIFSTKEPLTIPQILTTVFKENNYLDYDISGITKKYEPLVSCTQYNESHFNFVSRLMEQHGLYYYFKHEHDRHILCIADGGLPTLTQAPHQLQFGLENPDKTAALTDWHNVSSVMGSASCTSIFNFGQPGKPRIVDMREPKKKNVVVPTYTNYRYDKDSEHDDLDTLTKKHWTRIEGFIMSSSLNLGGSNTFMQPYDIMHVDADGRKKLDGDFLIAAVHHHFKDSSRRGHHNDSDSSQSYENRLFCYPAIYGFTPGARYNEWKLPERLYIASATKRPDVQLMKDITRPLIIGTQPAVVVGSGDYDIYTDQFGRIKVQMHWDRHGQKDQYSSCWIRVSRHWNGDRWGTHFTPRVGQEVLVEFRDGDPDKPAAVGTAHNSTHKMPFTPDKTPFRSGIKTRTVGSDNPDDANILRFDDSKDNPEVFLQAQRNLEIHAGGNLTKRVKGDSKYVIEKGKYELRVGTRLNLHASKSMRFVCGTSQLLITPNEIQFQADKIEIDQGIEFTPPSLAGPKGAMAHIVKQLQPEDTDPVPKLIIQVCDRYNQSNPRLQQADITPLINQLNVTAFFYEGDTLKSQRSAPLKSCQALFDNFDPGTSSISVKITGGNGYDNQAIYIIGKNGQLVPAGIFYEDPPVPSEVPLPPKVYSSNLPEDAIDLNPADWQHYPVTQDENGNPIYYLTLTILEPLTLFNFRQEAWLQAKDANTGQSRLTGEAHDHYTKFLKRYFKPQAEQTGIIDTHMPDWLLQHHQHQGNNVTILIHGYNVPMGALCESESIRDPNDLMKQYAAVPKADGSKAALYDPDKPQKNGAGAYSWLMSLEYHLNKAAGFDGTDYSKYTRLIGVTWQGNPASPSDYMAAVPLAYFPGDKVFKLVQQCHAKGLKINLMAHSLGNAVLWRVLDLCGQAGIKIDHVFSWEAAIPDDSFDNKARRYYAMKLPQTGAAATTTDYTTIPYGYNYLNAQKGLKKVTVLYSGSDNILGALPLPKAYQDPRNKQNTEVIIKRILHDSVVMVLAAYTPDFLKPKSWDTEEIRLYSQKVADPGGGIIKALSSLIVYLIDDPVTSALDSQPLRSIYHLANIYVDPLSHFFNPDHLAPYYAQWCSQYDHFELKGNPTPFASTLAEQEQVLRQAYPELYSRLDEVVARIKRYANEEQAESKAMSKQAAEAIHETITQHATMGWWHQHFNEFVSALKKAELLVTPLESLSEKVGDDVFDSTLWLHQKTDAVLQTITSSQLFQRWPELVTVMLTSILTKEAKPAPALGWGGAASYLKQEMRGKYNDTAQKDNNGKDVCIDHCAMHFPDKDMMQYVFEDQLIYGKLGQQFQYFGKYLENG